MRQIPRLFVETTLSEDMLLPLEAAQAHYVANVLRLNPGSFVHLFDDRTGEWQAVVAEARKREVILRVGTMLRPRETVPDLWLLTAPIRRERFEWIVEKATELGVSRIQPVITERTNRDSSRPDRLLAHMIEAAEQCERTALPELAPSVRLADLLADWEDRPLWFADEEGGEPLTALAPAYPAALLIGPEGGFSDAERAAILRLPAARRLGLGPRILRADTAVVAAIAQFQLLAGW